MYQFTGSRDPVRLTPALNPAMTPEIWCKPLKGLTGAAGTIFTLRMASGTRICGFAGLRAC